MARRKGTKEADPARRHRWLLEAAALLLVAGGLLLGIALGTYHPSDPSWGVEAPGASVENLIGPLGADLAWSFYEVLGFSAWLLPPLLVVFGVTLLLGRRVHAHLVKIAGAALFVASLASLLHLAYPLGVTLRGGTLSAGGYLGRTVARALAGGLHATGATLVLGTGALIGILLLTQVSLAQAMAWIGHGVKGMLGSVIRGIRAAFASLGSGVDALARRLGGGARWAVDQQRRALSQRRQRREERRTERAARKAAARASRQETEPGPKAARKRLRRKRAVKKRAAASSTQSEPAPSARAPTPSVAPATTPAPAAGRRRSDAGAYVLPPLDLFDAPDTEGKADEDALLHNARVIVAKYAEFSIEGQVLHIHPGPVVTTYEFKPEAGVKYSKITGLAEDLALALKAESIRIDRIPGKSTVGIEVPNPKRRVIRLTEILDSEVYDCSSSRLTLALGKSIEGEPYVTDLAKMPHLLIAGATGSGKSVALNSMLGSILFRSTPEEVRLILIDPKRLELGLYQDLPHLYAPVVTDPKLAVNALQWAVSEMEDRYKLLAQSSVRNIDQYNRQVAEIRETGTAQEEEELPEPLPYIVIVVDELADLMLVTKGGVEEALARLAQMARAVGIHLILATQRPSVDVLTGVIKANFPSRISFRVFSRVDSRTVLDSNGAEQLLGKGDLLFLPPGSARLLRLHAPLLTESEISRLTEHWRDQAAPRYREDVIEPPQAPERELEAVEDELYDQAARIVVERQEASVSYLQRRLRIGYARAARLVDLMELDGLVGPSPETGGKMREVLVPASYFQEVDEAHVG